MSFSATHRWFSSVLSKLILVATLIAVAPTFADAKTTRQHTDRMKGKPFTAAECANSYRLKIETGDWDEGGTDGLIDITLFGENGTGARFTNVDGAVSGNAFSANTTDYLYLCPSTDIIGRVTKVKVELTYSNFAPAWDLKKITVTHPDSENAVFNFLTTLKSGRQTVTENCGTCVAKSKQWNAYSVKIKTSTGTGAGTDANIFLTLSNTDGKSDRYRLNSLVSLPELFKPGFAWGGLFREGESDTFIIWNPRSLTDIGIVKLENSGAYSASDWRVDDVEITDKDGNKVRFVFDKWINGDTPPSELSGKRLIDLNNPRLQPVKTIDYKFSSTLGDLDDIPSGTEGTWKEELSYTLGRTLRMTSASESKIGIGGKAGWRPASAADGYYAEVSASWEKKNSKSLDDLSSYAQTKHTTRAYERHKDELLVMVCTWSAKYQTYDIGGVGGTVSPIGFISENPKCAESIKRFPSTHKQMVFGIYNALKQQFSENQFEDIISNLEARGVTIDKHRFRGDFVISNTYKCPGHQFCNWNLSWDSGDPHPMASVEDDGFSWKIKPVKGKPNTYKILNTWNCPTQEWCNAELSWDTTDGPHPRASVEHNDPVDWLITEDVDGLFSIQSTYGCPHEKWCNAYLSWDTEDPHPMASVENKKFTWQIEKVR